MNEIGKSFEPAMRGPILHEFDSDGGHRLIVNGEPSDWFEANELATNGEFYGRSEQIAHAILPSVFIVQEIESVTLPFTDTRPDE